MRARVYVTLKSGILDPQGQDLEKTLGRLGFDEVQGVRRGKFVEIEINETSRDRALSRLDAMCSKLIANTVIEDYRVELEES